MKFISNENDDKEQIYKGRNYKGAFRNKLSSIYSKTYRDKPIGILNTNSSTHSLTDIKSINNSSRKLSHSYQKRNNSSNYDITRRSRTLTINTFISTSETDNKQQDTLDNFSYDKNLLRKVYKKQLSKISENPNIKYYNKKKEKKNNELTINNYNINKNNVNNSIIINNISEKRRSRNSFYINKTEFNKKMKFRIFSGKNLYNTNQLLKDESNNLNENYPSDCPMDIKQIRLGEICKNLIEKNKLKKIEIQKKKLHFVSKFNVIDNNLDNVNTNKQQLIINYIINIKNEIKKNLNNNNIKTEKISLTQLKKDILISEKTKKREFLILKYVEKSNKLKKKIMTNIVLYNYACNLSEFYFSLNIYPKTIRVKLEANTESNIIDNFGLGHLRRRSSIQIDNISKLSNVFCVRKTTKKFTTNTNIIIITKKSIKYVNEFKILDFYNLTSKTYEIVNKGIINPNNIKKLFFSQKHQKKSVFGKSIRNSKIKFELLYHKLNAENISPKNNKKNYDKPLFSKIFYKRNKFQQNINKKVKTPPKARRSLISEMKKNNVFLYTDDLKNNKEHTLLRTLEIKTVLESKLKDELEKLIYSIKDSNYYLFRRIFEQYTISPNLQDKKGNTLLSLAVQSNCFQIVNFLLNSGANPNISNVKFFF